MKALLYSGLARVVGYVPQGIAALVASHLVIVHYGVGAFASYTLILTVMALIPLGNLGVGASVTQAIAVHGAGDEQSERTGLTGARVMTVSMLVVGLAAIAIGLLGQWPRFLGIEDGTNAVVALALVLYGISFLPALGASVLLAVQRNHIVIAAQALQPVVGLGLVALLVVLDADERMLLVVPTASVLVVSTVTMVLSERLGPFPWSRILRRVGRLKAFPGVRIRSLTGPMVITSVCIPLAFLGDRIVLSQVSTSQEVARYSLVLQIFGPVTGLILATAQPLWPMFTQARAQGGRGPRLALVFGGFVGATLVASAVLVLLADPFGSVISSDEIELGYTLPIVAAGVTVVQAIAFPLAMSMVDPAGARFTAICSVLQVPANLTLAVFLAREWGAVGPMVSAITVALTIQIVPALIFTARRNRNPEKIAVL